MPSASSCPTRGARRCSCASCSSSEAFRTTDATLPLVLGKNIAGTPVFADLARMPHLLVAGTTGSGKSVGVNAMILSLLYRLSPEQCRFLMIDPKMLELSVYNGIPHLLCPVVTEPAKAVAALNWVVAEMEERYRRMATLAVRNIDVFNNRVRNAQKRVEPGSAATAQADLAPMPYIVVVVDEFADLMIVAGKEIEAAVQRLAQMARAAGIHLIMATQRPSVDIVTGTIKANFPTRISYKVASKIDSRTILNEQGAEQLLGQGDMLFSNGTGRTLRVHGPFVSDEEVERIAAYLRDQGEPRYVDGITDGGAAEEEPDAGAKRARPAENDLYDRAVAIVLDERKASTSYLQRRLAIGYNRAADLMERMERDGIVSAPGFRGRRQILLERRCDARRTVVGVHHGTRCRVAGRSALKSPTILSQCWDKRWSFGRIMSAEWRTLGELHARTLHGAARVHRGACLGAGMGAGAGRQEAGAAQPGRRGRDVEPDASTRKPPSAAKSSTRSRSS